MFAKVPLGSARNKMVFELSDLHKFMTNKAGVFRGWTLPLYTDQHTSQRKQSFSLTDTLRCHTSMQYLSVEKLTHRPINFEPF